jgi:hypothetical protein
MSSDGVLELLCSKRVIPVAAFAELDTVLPVGEALEVEGPIRQRWSFNPAV